MMRATARCHVCDTPFRFIQVTKPMRYCSAACSYKAERSLANARRRAKAALKRIARRADAKH